MYLIYYHRYNIYITNITYYLITTIFFDPRPEKLLSHLTQDSLHRDPPPGTVCLILNGKGCCFFPLPPFKKNTQRHHGGYREFPHWDHRHGVLNKLNMNG